MRIAGGGTKLGWGAPVEADVELLSTAGLDRSWSTTRATSPPCCEAGVPLARAQERFAEAGQMLALDPPDARRRTIGGVVATGDSGPLRHRYGAPRDLVLGMTVALPDGTVARAGGKVIKNVAGYDLAKLFAGSFGTLGRDRRGGGAPAPAARGDRDRARAAPTTRTRWPRAAAALAHAPLEPEALDVAWEAGAGARARPLRRRRAPEPRREAPRELLARPASRPSWSRTTTSVGAPARGAASADGAVVRVSGAAGRARRRAARAGEHGAARWSAARRSGSAGSRSRRDRAEARRRRCAALAPAPCVVLDAPEEVRAAIDPWGVARRGAARADAPRQGALRPDRAVQPRRFVGRI